MYAPYDPRSLDHHILTGHVVNAIKATKSINSIIYTTILTQTISKTLKTANPEAVTKKKNVLIFSLYKEELNFYIKALVLDY